MRIDHSDVDFATFQFVQQLGQHCVPHRHFHPGMALMETSEKARYANRPDGGHDVDSQRCLAQQREIARDLVCGSGAGQHLFEMRLTMRPSSVSNRRLPSR